MSYKINLTFIYNGLNNYQVLLVPTYRKFQWVKLELLLVTSKIRYEKESKYTLKKY